MISKSTQTIAALTLSATLVGCREEYLRSQDSEVAPAARQSQAHSLAEARTINEGGRVYLRNITLSPILSHSNRVDGARYHVIDEQGARMLGILDAPPESFLWSLTPFSGESSYSDFGAIKKVLDGEPTLFIFKLAN